MPTVNYKLWPATLALLQEYRSDQERVLLTESGKPCKWKDLVEGKLRKSDNIDSCYAHLKDKLKGFKKPLKGLRKTGTTILDLHPVHRHFSPLFLGQSARTIKDRHYSIPDQKGFDEAVLWLGRQPGQVPAEEPAQQPKKARARKGR